PAYMSPEQIGGTLELDARSDIYSLGCVLYEMLAGEPPHTGRSAQSIFAKRLAEPVPSVRTVRETVPIPIDQALKKAMAKAPPDRFSTAAGFADVLEGRTLSVPHVAEQGRGPSRTRVAGMVVIATALAWLVLSLGPDETLAYSEGEWILVTEFQNATGDSVLDKSLDLALSLTLQQSPHIKVFPAARVQTALGRMLLDAQSRITESVGREIALREGVRFVLVPSVAAVGDRYALGLSFQDPSSDEPLRTELIHVDGKEEILEGLDELGSRARRVLGESRGMVRERVPLVDVTTSSLPALRQFSLGFEAKARFIDVVEARRLFASALAIDGDFIAAHAELGILELEAFGDREEGVRHLTLALANLDRLTDFEGRMISGLYKDLVEQDPTGALDEYRTVAELYPNRSEPRNNLGWLFWRMGRLDEAVAAYKEALRVDEGFHWAYGSLNRLQLFQMGMLDSGLVAARRQLDQDDEFDYAWAHVGWALTARDSLEAARAAFERAVELNPREGLHWEGLAHSYRLMGRVEDAAAALTSVLELDSLSLNGWYELGQLYQVSGDAARGDTYLAGARRILERRLSVAPDAASSLARLSLVLTRLGDEAGAAQAAERALESGGASPLVLFELGCAAMARGDRSAALDYLERAVASGYTNVLWLMRHPDLEPLWSDPAFTS
ncbi:MAG TPA: tetratricopeptide repeat protein, partial [Longimicrobiales bacterium]|nr:tetratricopeptide repeat protein [Longimicrobiales bacterium]